MPKMTKKNIKNRVMLELSDEHLRMLGYARKWIQFDLEDLFLPKKFTGEQMKQAFIKQIPNMPPGILDDYKVYYNPKWVAGFYAISNSPKYPDESLFP